jgi:hypothetical protein
MKKSVVKKQEGALVQENDITEHFGHIESIARCLLIWGA